VGKELRVNEFKTLFKRLKQGNPVFDHLLLAVLVWLEEQFLDLRVETAVSRAVHDYERLEMGTDEELQPTYSESGTDFFDEMRLTSSFLDKNF